MFSATLVLKKTNLEEQAEQKHPTPTPAQPTRTINILKPQPTNKPTLVTKKCQPNTRNKGQHTPVTPTPKKFESKFRTPERKRSPG